ncbi:MAG: 1-acyl-sn-glycerol-3-phosphate acyltransferase [Saprospiraceae bacterium]|nr:1-acyl-sn-glycerol-3-phosphate acyltransferase [Saprospiraceae bacterium]
MLKLIAKLILKIAGWKAETPPLEGEADRCVILAVPHTSNWDYLYALSFGFALDLDFKVAIKHFWTVFPFGLIIKPLGGLGIKRGKERNKAMSQMDMMADLFKTNEKLALVIAPEGTRKLRKKWKSGFYHVAHNAEVPLLPVYMDYLQKRVIFGPLIDSSGTRDEVMQKVTDYYSSIDGAPLKPKQHTLDENYVKK